MKLTLQQQKFEVGEYSTVYEWVHVVSKRCQGNGPNRNLVPRQVSTEPPWQRLWDCLQAAYLPGHAVNCRWTITLVARDSGAHTDTILSIQWERAFELCKVSFIFPIANSWPFSTGQYTWPSNYIDIKKHTIWIILFCTFTNYIWPWTAICTPKMKEKVLRSHKSMSLHSNYPSHTHCSQMVCVCRAVRAQSV